MNLLPEPRSVELGDGLTENKIAGERIDASLPAQGYELHIGTDGATIVAADAAGAFYARATLTQLAHEHDGSLPIGRIRDHPDLLVRGVMLDISRDKVPTTDTLHQMIDRLASWKVNQLQLYSEHTFAYSQHPEVSERASALTADEIRELDAYCRERFVELVPNQNTLGHMNRWLQHARYRPLALAPDGFKDPWGLSHEAMTIDPSNPQSLKLVRGLLVELLPNFTSRRVHVGLDETWDLPRERHDEFFKWVATLRGLPELDGYEMLIWGDEFSGHPEQIAQLPAGVTVCEWGYDGDYPFDERVGMLADAGVPFWVAPGNSGWLSVGGRYPNAIENCRNAATAALAHGGAGYLNTDWGDRGYLQQLPIGDPGWAYGAAVSWCLDTNTDLDVAGALSVHVYDDPNGGIADALLTIGDAYTEFRAQVPNHSILVMHLYFPQIRVGAGLTRGLTTGEIDAVDARLASARTSIEKARSRRPDATLLRDELTWTIDVLQLMMDDARARLAAGHTLASVPEDERRALCRRLDDIIERHRVLWLARNRPGGLSDSASWLTNLKRAYETGEVEPNWGGWPPEFC